MAGSQSSYPHMPRPITRSAAALAAPREAPGLRGWLSGWSLMREPLVFLEKMFCDYGNVARTRILNLRIYLIAHPEGIKHVLHDNHRIYR